MIIKSFKTKKRTGLSLERNQLHLKHFLNSPINLPLLTPAINVEEPTSSAPCPPPVVETPVLRGDCDKCTCVRKESAKAVKTITSSCSSKVNAAKSNLARLKKSLNGKYVAQYRKRKDVQLYARNMKIQCKDTQIKELQEQVTKLSKKVDDLDDDKRQLKQKIKVVLRENSLLKRKLCDIKFLKKRLTDVEKDCDLLQSILDSSGEDELIVKNKKQYNTSLRKVVYNCLLHNLPVESIGPVISYTIHTLTNTSLQTHPSPHTCAQMMRELGVLSDLQSVEQILHSASCCLAWDATTLDGAHAHVHELHINTPNAVFTLNTQQLPGGKAIDYVQHIIDTISHLGNLYAKFNNGDQEDIKTAIQGKILSTLTDRAAANHATVVLLEEKLGLCLLELNCQLHPLDGLANAARSTLRCIDQERQLQTRSFDSDCKAANVLHLVSKLRYKAKGDPTGFKAHLRAKGLSCGTFVRYVGNRLHVIFHLAGTVFHHRDVLVQFETMCSNKKMGSALKSDLPEPIIIYQLQALGLLGKLITGPWMALFYTSATERKHFELSEYLKCAVHKLEILEHQSEEIVNCTEDIFGRPLVVDETLRRLRVCDNIVELSYISSKLISSFITVLKRQLGRYIYGDLCNPSDDLLRQACAAPVHNIWAERNLGMYDAQSRRSPNALVSFLDSKCKAMFNKTLSWLDSADEQHQWKLVSFAVSVASKIRKKETSRTAAINDEILKRAKDKVQMKDMNYRRKVEKELKAALLDSSSNQVLNGLAVGSEMKSQLEEIIRSPQSLVGKKISHVWYEDGGDVLYLGKVLKVTKKSMDVTISYWTESESEEDASDFKIKFVNVITDISLGDMLFI